MIRRGVRGVALLPTGSFSGAVSTNSFPRKTPDLNRNNYRPVLLCELYLMGEVLSGKDIPQAAGCQAGRPFSDLRRTRAFSAPWGRRISFFGFVERAKSHPGPFPLV